MSKFRVIQRQNSFPITEISAASVIERCVAVTQGLKGSLDAEVEGDHGECLVPLEQYEEYVEAAKAIAAIEGFFPRVECYVVGYYWSDGKHWSGFWGCRTEEQANAIADAFNAEQPLGNKHRKDDWIVRRTGINFGNLVKAEWTPEEAVAHMKR